MTKKLFKTFFKRLYIYTFLNRKEEFSTLKPKLDKVTSNRKETCQHKATKHAYIEKNHKNMTTYEKPDNKDTINVERESTSELL